MSLSIPSRKITAVKIGEEWIEVERGTNTFDIDAYEVEDDEHPNGYYSMGRDDFLTFTGFSFTGVDGAKYFGPVTAITAFRTRE